jgi:hypothetical protein
MDYRLLRSSAAEAVEAQSGWRTALRWLGVSAPLVFFGSASHD